jgi:2,3-bisphosphoglycerate-dependent phosphoglycerate mutase
MPILVIVRHGQSLWNLENRFTGDVDVPLTEQGRMEARAAGEKLTDLNFNLAFTSGLSRAMETLQIILRTIGEENIPVIRDPALNERNYGELQGLNKSETAREFGDKQVEIWRRSFDVAPPGGESLHDTAARVIPFYEQKIRPELQESKNILIVAHGNSLRSLMMHLENINVHDIAGLDLPTGKPRIYQFDKTLHLLSYSYL